MASPSPRNRPGLSSLSGTRCRKRCERATTSGFGRNAKNGGQSASTRREGSAQANKRRATAPSLLRQLPPAPLYRRLGRGQISKPHKVRESPVRLVAAWVNRTLLRILRFNCLTRLRTSEPQRRVGRDTTLDKYTNKAKKPRYNGVPIGAVGSNSQGWLAFLCYCTLEETNL